MQKLWVLLGLLLLPVSVGAVLAEEEAAMSLGQTYTADFFNDDMGPIWENMTQQMRDALGSEEGLRQFREKVEHDVGAERPAPRACAGRSRRRLPACLRRRR